MKDKIAPYCISSRTFVCKKKTLKQSKHLRNNRGLCEKITKAGHIILLSRIFLERVFPSIVGGKKISLALFAIFSTMCIINAYTTDDCRPTIHFQCHIQFCITPHNLNLRFAYDDARLVECNRLRCKKKYFIKIAFSDDRRASTVWRWFFTSLENKTLLIKILQF